MPIGTYKERHPSRYTAQEILAARDAVYQAARATHPERWSGETRNWSPIGAVSLNPATGNGMPKSSKMKTIDATTTLKNAETSMLKQNLKVLYMYLDRIPQELRELVLRKLSGDGLETRVLSYSDSEKKKFEALRWADVILFAPGRCLPAEFFEKATHIKLMQLWSSGYDKFNLADAKKFNIPVANNGGANAVSVAEHTLLLMLAVAKRLPDSHARVVHGQWAGNRHGMDMFLLHKKTLGILGLGRIGCEVAKRARGFMMNVIYYDPKRAPPEVEHALGVKFASWDEVLKTSDVLTLHMHLTDQTRGCLGAKELSQLKPGAVIINVSRAELIDEEALIEKLASGHIGGFGNDAHYTEPTNANDPLLTHPDVVATPHMAGSTVDAYETALDNAMQNFRRVQNGEKPLWIVNGAD